MTVTKAQHGRKSKFYHFLILTTTVEVHVIYTLSMLLLMAFEPVYLLVK